MKRNFTIILVFFLMKTFASTQIPDYIIYGKDTVKTYNLLLEKHLQKLNPIEDKLFGLSFRNTFKSEGLPFNCWRGYQAIYEVKNDSLFLVYITDCFELSDKKIIDKKRSNERMKILFEDKLTNNRMFVDWYTGKLSYPLNIENNRTLRFDGVFYRIFENEKVFKVTKGKIKEIKDVKNYEHIANRINRIEKDSVQKIIFNELYKFNWNNYEDFDCSEQYIITINEIGRISEVKMTYDKKQINDYFDKGEYEFCVKKIKASLKNLKFDILKDKGEPVSENIFIKIWVENDGKIQNGIN